MASPSPTTILNRYELTKLLGQGTFAKVYLARNLKTLDSVAIKILSKDLVLKSNLADHIKREISILRRLRHPYVVHLLEVMATKSKIYFVMEYVRGGELFSKVSKGRLKEDAARRYFHQLISAVQFCHARGVFHRDLKPENLLLDEKGDLKVSDFGLSAIPDQIKADGLYHTICGTPAYVAPEILAKKGYSASKIDVWSCGIILFVLIAGYLPFNDANMMSLYRKIYRGEFKCPVWVSGELRHLIGRLLDKNPETRITVDEIVEHPWFMKGMEEGDFEFGEFESEEEFDFCKVSKAEAVDKEKREINAFDIIGFASGVDLSGMFGGEGRERFVSGEKREVVLRRVEEKGRREGLVVSRKGEKGRVGVVVRGQKGNLVVGMEVYRLSGELTVFEVERGGEEGWEGEFWREGDRL